ncbi:MAG TPA: ATPase, T2SS/T4P/T4SS family, partial [Candidatus Aminicenantes bacterium]|nr:ATPase, T2SS/T4P/T4SS family [Candidatus Aminicenantes bacterium]
MLVRDGKLTAGQLAEALEKQAVTKKKLGEIVVMMGWIAPEDLNLYLMNQKWLKAADLSTVSIQSPLLDRVGGEVCLEHRIVPLEIQTNPDGEVLRFAFHSSAQLGAMRHDERLKEFKLLPQWTERAAIEDYLHRWQNQDTELRRQFEKLVRNAVHFGATVIELERVGDTVAFFFRTEGRRLKITPKLTKPLALYEKTMHLAGVGEGSGRTECRRLFVTDEVEGCELASKRETVGEGERLTIHVIYPEPLDLVVDELPLNREEREAITHALNMESGLVLVVGSSGSATHETMYTLMNTLTAERPAAVEDPVRLTRADRFQVSVPDRKVDIDVLATLLEWKPKSLFLFNFTTKTYAPAFIGFSLR